MDTNQIANEILEIGKDCQKQLFNNPHQWTAELATRQAHLARVAGIQPQAERLYLKAFAIASATHKEQKTPSAIIKKCVEADCADELFLLSSSEQLFKTLCVQIDSLRTLISQAKSEQRAG